MKLANWFKILWWIFILVLCGILLGFRVDEIVDGQSVPADVFIFLIFVALMLVPIFSEISFFGIKLKKEIEELKSNLDLNFGELKNEIHNTQTQTLFQTIQTLAPPPPDNKLPELEEEIERIVKEKFSYREIKEKKISPIEVPENNLILFKTRYSIEIEVSRIWEGRFGKEYPIEKRRLPILRKIQDLVKYEIVSQNLYGVLKEILAICNYGIHGEKVSDSQVSFVSKNSKEIIDYLKDLK
ncbi:MAG: hypothetical protein GF353_05055 [Candidatus Lokiarchaeota archaeon]|nr:hypothetical protein [Candidatus Lokiarchaeota archaeon]